MKLTLKTQLILACILTLIIYLGVFNFLHTRRMLQDNVIMMHQQQQQTDDISMAVEMAKQIVQRHRTGNYVLVTLINDAFLSFAHSWLCNTMYMNIHSRVLFLSSDEQTKRNLTSAWQNISTVVMGDLAMKGDQEYSHAGYLRLIVARTQILQAILQQDIEIFLFEVDCLWLKNPIPTFLNYTGQYDILVNPVSARPGIIAGGFLYMFNTPAMKSTWQLLTHKLQQLNKKLSNLSPGTPVSEGENDQVYLSSLVMSKHAGLKYKILPLNEYADGKWYSYTESRRKQLHPLIINNNWVLGNKKKIHRAKKWSHWFVKNNITCKKDLVKKTLYV